MSDREKFVAVSLLTAPEFNRWGSRLRHVYRVEDTPEFSELLIAIDKADEENKMRAENTGKTLKS